MHRWFGRHRWVVDAVVVTAVVGYSQLALPTVAQDGAKFWVLQVISLGLCAAWALRRRGPRRAAAAALAAAWAQLLLTPPALVPADVVLPLVVGHLASRTRWAVSVPAAAAAVVWVPLACLPLVRDGLMRLGTPGLMVVAVAWAWTWGTLVQVRRDHAAALAQSADHRLHEQEARHRAVLAEERAHIAREIHDIVSHGLGIMVVVADGAAHTVATDPDRAARAMVEVRDTGRDAMAEMRRMLTVLRGTPEGIAPPPGTDRLEDLVEHVRSTGLPVTLEVTGTRRTSPGLDLTVYRVVQEALTNARRHGGPRLSRIDVGVRHEDDRVEIEITDDGAGPTTLAPDGTADDSPGHGLVGMRERVASHGGTLTSGAHPGGGFVVHATIPTLGGVE